MGGLLTTCGLTQVGAPGEDGDEVLGVHGRISHLPAESVNIHEAWQDEEYVIKIEGTLKETSLYAENLVLRRTITTKMGETRFWIHDSIRNEGYNETPFMVLYHVNFGYPVVSNGDHYDGREIPDHDTRPEFEEPAIWWTPVISPGDMIVYRGALFPGWRGNALAAGLSSRAIVRIELDDDGAREVERYPMGARIRSIAEAPDGALWVLEDERAESTGRLLRLTPED